MCASPTYMYAVEAVKHNGFKVLPHLPYYPEIDYIVLSPNVKKNCMECHFQSEYALHL